jgi:hypothetical protein
LKYLGTFGRTYLVQNGRGIFMKEQGRYINLWKIEILKRLGTFGRTYVVQNGRGIFMKY